MNCHSRTIRKNLFYLYLVSFGEAIITSQKHKTNESYTRTLVRTIKAMIYIIIN